MRFETGAWQPKELQVAIAEHNAKVKALWLACGYNPLDDCWWHITEISLGHLRPSPQWKKQMEELQLAKECEAAIRKGLKVFAKRRHEEEEKYRLLQAVADELQEQNRQPR